MRFFAKQICSHQEPSKDMLVDRYVLLVNKYSENSISTWCGHYNNGRYDSIYFSYRNNIYERKFETNTYNGYLNFPISMKVYLVDKIGFELYKKIISHRDLIVFLDNVDV